MVCFKEKFNGETIFHLKRIKVVLLHVKGLIKTIAKFKAEKILLTFVSQTKHPFEGHKILYTKTMVLCSIKH